MPQANPQLYKILGSLLVTCSAWRRFISGGCQIPMLGLDGSVELNGLEGHT